MSTADINLLTAQLLQAQERIQFFETQAQLHDAQLTLAEQKVAHAERISEEAREAETEIRQRMRDMERAQQQSYSLLMATMQGVLPPASKPKNDSEDI